MSYLAEVAIIRTGSANIASVVAALTRLGTTTHITDSPEDVLATPFVVLPGVGAFGAAMAYLRERGLDKVICARVRQGRPLLAICLGMQLLCSSSEESPGVEGLGIVPASVRRFGPSLRVPQMGWNRTVPTSTGGLLQADWMYFANSFRVESVPADWNATMTEYGGNFVSAFERESILACQFHPELSGTRGQELIARWLEQGGSRKVEAC